MQYYKRWQRCRQDCYWKTLVQGEPTLPGSKKSSTPGNMYIFKLKGLHLANDVHIWLLDKELLGIKHWRYTGEGEGSVFLSSTLLTTFFLFLFFFLRNGWSCLHYSRERAIYPGLERCKETRSKERERSPEAEVSGEREYNFQTSSFPQTRTKSSIRARTKLILFTTIFLVL